MTNKSYNIEQVNNMNKEEFVAAFGTIIEHSPWVAEVAWSQKPFADSSALACSMVQIMRGAENTQQRAILNAHPELSGKEAEEGILTEFSSSEQSRIGLNRLTRENFARVRSFNQHYRDRFGFPFIVCVAALKNLQHLFQLQQQRIERTCEKEMDEAIYQVGQIAESRLAQLIEDRKNQP